MNHSHTSGITEWNKFHPCLVAMAIVWEACEQLVKERTATVCCKCEEWKHIVGHDCLAKFGAWKASHLWSHWKKTRKWTRSMMYVPLCTKTTAYKKLNWSSTSWSACIISPYLSYFLVFYKLFHQFMLSLIRLPLISTCPRFVPTV